MKQIIIAIAILLVGYSATAQTQVATDSLVTSSSADTVRVVSPTNYFAGVDGTFTASITATRYSGTVAANTYAILQHSVDGTNYTNLECPCTYGTTVTTQDSVALSNVATAQPIIWNCKGVKSSKVRVWLQAPSSTVGIQVKGYFIKK